MSLGNYYNIIFKKWGEQAKYHVDSNIITVGMDIDNSIGKLTPDRN